jgi:hypothetical protein
MDMRFRLSVFLALGLLAFAAGCGGERSGEAPLGDSDSQQGPVTTLASPEEAAAIGKLKQEWRQILAAGADDDPVARFDNLTEDEFRGRLQEAANRYGFRVVEIHWLKPLQAAPLVVVEANNPALLARDVPAILRLLDPYADAGEDWQDWSFEGFFFEARDEDGSPFLAVYSHRRGFDRGWGEWARSESLYPFPHTGPSPPPSQTDTGS